MHTCLGNQFYRDFDAGLVEVSKVIVVGKTSASGWVSAPFVLVPYDGVFGPFDLTALCGCHT
jgi:hypothetical protein